MPPLRQPPDRKESMDSLLMKTEKLQAGDVIYIDRVLYRHYGIAGKGRVIHYPGNICQASDNKKYELV